MKVVYLIVGLVLGAGTMYFIKGNPPTIESKSVELETNSDWAWPDSLDALVAAGDNHKLVFENDEFRILSVTVVPGVLDPIHTHKGKSIVWVDNISPILYNVYDFDKENKLELVRTDTIIVKPEEIDQYAWENPEPPHSVENIGSETFHLYRLEYK